VSTGYGIACGSSGGSSSSFPGGDGGSTDAGGDAFVACGGCGCGDSGAPTTTNLTAAQACDLIASNTQPQDGFTEIHGSTCDTYCPSAPFCEVPVDFANQYAALNPDAGTVDDAGAVDGGDGGATLQCPTSATPVVITCGQYGCLGRLTEGFTTPKNDAQSAGDRFAAMAFLEAVSVHAFDRLERELRSHGARADLLRNARRARRDEQRHTVMMTRLARLHGTTAQLPDAPNAAPVRSLFEIALENAVEGCVRETYGAVVGLVEAETAADASLRKTMRSIAPDECRHAELAWAVHEWVTPQLSHDEQARVRHAMKEAIAEIAARDPQAAALLFGESS
jgi:hypothetical protein